MTQKVERVGPATLPESDPALEETKRRIDQALSAMTLTEIEQLVEVLERMLGEEK